MGDAVSFGDIREGDGMSNYSEIPNNLTDDLGVDLISREQAKAAIRDKFKDLPSRVEINTILNELPSVTPQEPKTGNWNEIPKYKDIAWMCSECGRFTTMKHNYCPNCGAKMVEPQEI